MTKQDKIDRAEAGWASGIAATFNRAYLIDALNLASMAIKKRPSVPLLGGALLRCFGDRFSVTDTGLFSVTGTGLDAQISVRGACDAALPGDLVLETPRKLVAALKLTDSETVDIAAQMGKDFCGRINVTAGDIILTAPNDLDAGDFPLLKPTISTIISATVGKDFAAALRRVKPAMSGDQARYYLNGIAVHHVADWTFALVATDGHRLHIAHVQLPDAVRAGQDGGDGTYIIPREAVKIMLALLKNGNDGSAFKIWAGSARGDGLPKLTLETGTDVSGATLTLKLIDGTYPDYGKVIPKKTLPRIEVDSTELRRAITAVTATLTEKMRMVKLTPDAKNGAMTVETCAPKGFSGKTTIAAQIDADFIFEGRDHSFIGFNSKQLLEAMTALGGERLQFCWTEGGQWQADPTLLLNPADATFRVVLMPMRV